MSLSSTLWSRRGILLGATTLFLLIVFFYLFRLSLPYRSVQPFRLPESNRVFTEQGVLLSPIAFPVGEASWPGAEVQVFSDPLELMGANRNDLLRIVGLEIPWHHTSQLDRETLKQVLQPRRLRFQSIELEGATLAIAPRLDGQLNLRAERQPSGALTVVGDMRLPGSHLDFSARLGWDNLEEFLLLEGITTDPPLKRLLFSGQETLDLPEIFWSLLPPLQFRAQSLLDASMRARSRVVLAEGSSNSWSIAGSRADLLQFSLGLVEQEGQPSNLRIEATADRVSWGELSWWKVWALGRQKSGGPAIVDLGWENSAVEETHSRLRLEIEEDTGSGHPFRMLTVKGGRTVPEPLASGKWSRGANGDILFENLRLNLRHFKGSASVLTLRKGPTAWNLAAAGLLINDEPVTLPTIGITNEGIEVSASRSDPDSAHSLTPAEILRLIQNGWLSPASTP